MAAGLQETLLMDAIVDPKKIPHFVSYAFLASGILIAAAVAVRSSLQIVPKGLQNLIEGIVEAFLKLADENIGHTWSRRLFPLIITLFLFILVCNLMGLIPGFTSATSNINTTASIAVPVFLATHYYGIRVHKLKYISHFVGPFKSLLAFPSMMFFFVLESITHLVRPVTLSVRLFGNMMAKHMILLILAIVAPAVFPVFILGLGVLVSVMQAYVFMLLTCLYLAGAVEQAH